MFRLILTEAFTYLESIRSNIHLLHEPGYIMPCVGNHGEQILVSDLNFPVEYEYEYRKHFEYKIM
jgi:hypothetical protein